MAETVEQSHFYGTFGIDVTERGEGFARVSAPCDARFSNPGNTMHGGYYCCVAQAAADAAALTVLGEGERATTLEYKINLFRPMMAAGESIAEARVSHRGRRSMVVVVELRDAGNKLYALMTATFGVSADGGSISFPAVRRWDRPVSGPMMPRREQAGGGSQFFATFAIEVEEMREAFARVSAPFHEQFTVADGSLHPAFFGGVADCAAGPGGMTVVDEATAVSTIEYKVNLFEPVYEGRVTALGHVVASGGGTLVMHIDVVDERERLVAVMLTTLAEIPRPTPA